MPEYNLIPQEEDIYCVCSVLQAIFNSHEIKMSQKEIAKKLTPSKKGFKVDDEKIKQFLENQGFKYEFYWYNETPFNEPDMLLEEKADIFLGWNHHLVLMNNFSSEIISYTDPKDAKNKQIEYHDLLRNMSKNRDGFFGLLRKL